MYGNSIPQHWGSDNKGQLTIGLSTEAIRYQVAHRTHLTYPQTMGRNIQCDKIFQIGWGNTMESLVCEEEDFKLDSLINRKPMKLTSIVICISCSIQMNGKLFISVNSKKLYQLKSHVQYAQAPEFSYGPKVFLLMFLSVSAPLGHPGWGIAWYINGLLIPWSQWREE